MEHNFPDLPVCWSPDEHTTTRCTLRGVDPDTPLRDVVAALAGSAATGTERAAAGDCVVVDGHLVPVERSLGEAGVRSGSTLTGAVPRPREPGLVGLLVVAGADVGRCFVLPSGRWVIGSSPVVSCTIADPDLQPHHAVIEVTTDGRVWVIDLGVGRPLALMDGTDGGGPVEIDHGPNERRWLTGSRLRFGTTVLELVAAPSVTPSAATSLARGRWTAPLVRRAAPPARRRITPTPPMAEQRSVPGATGVGITSSVIAVGTGVGAALILGQPALLVLSLLGALGAALATATSAWRRRRADRRMATLDAVARAAFEAELDVAADEIAAELRRAPRWTVVGGQAEVSALWSDRAESPTAWDVVLGTGSIEWPIVDAGGAAGGVIHRRLAEVGLGIPMTAGTIIAVTGRAADTRATARSMLLQLATALGPADLHIVVVRQSDCRAWDWAAWLPHTLVDGEPSIVDPSGLATLVERIDPGDTRALLLVLDGGELLAARTAAARRLLDGVPAARAIVLADPESVIPACCTAHFERTARTARLTVFTDPAGRSPVTRGDSIRLRPNGVGSATATAVGRRLAGWHDPEQVTGTSPLAKEVDLLTLLGARVASAEAIARTWDRLGGDPAPSGVIGAAGDGLVELDLERDGPHAFIAGTTGAGKSELLRSLVVSLAAASPPEHLSFVLIDYKGGSAFDRCSDLPHVVGMVTDLDAHLAERVLASLHAELRHRERILRTVGATDLRDLRSMGRRGDEHPTLARLVVVVDEFAALAAELPSFLDALVGVAQRGRSLGVHLVLATQRPSGVVSDDIRANTNLRLALRVQDAADALDVIGDRRAASLPRSCPGRAVLRLGPDELVEFQAARCTAPVAPSTPRVRVLGSTVGETDQPTAPATGGPTTLDLLVDRIGAAARTRGVDLPRRPWSEPLPAVLRGDGIGALDDVMEQCRRPLRWTPDAGHLLVAGIAGTGTTTTAQRIVLELVATRPPSELECYVVDGGSSWLAANGLPHCGAVVGLDDHEQLLRLIVRLEGRLEGRLQEPGSATLVVVDGVAALHSWLTHPDRLEWADRFDHLVAEGPSAGITFVFVTDQPSAVPLAWLARTPQRWVGRLADGGDALAAGIPARRALTASPPGRFVIADGTAAYLDAQIVLPEHPLDVEVARIAARWSDRAAAPVLPAVPPQFGIERLTPQPAPPGSGSGAVRTLALGLGLLDAAPVGLELHPGEHVVVAGPPRSGRTAALRLFGMQVATQDPDRRIIWIDGRRDRERIAAVSAAIEEAPVVHRWLVLVDDADRVDDPAFTRLVSEDRPGLLVVAAGRPDALRAAGYAHWTATIRRARRGLLLGTIQDTDTDLLGVAVPRRALLKAPVRSGRGLLIADGRVTGVQLALAPDIEFDYAIVQ